MFTKENKKAIRQKKHYRMRNHLAGTSEAPRLAVFRSNMHMYAQIIDDSSGALPGGGHSGRMLLKCPMSLRFGLLRPFRRD